MKTDQTASMEDAEITGKGKRVANLVTAKDQAESEKAVTGKYEKYNRSLLEASLDPLVAIGPNGVVTDVNTATESATGIPREKLIGTVFPNTLLNPAKRRPDISWLSGKARSLITS